VAISVFDLFKVGIGPSSSHTVGPMNAARLFVTGLQEDGPLPRTGSVRAELFGSPGATGHGHGSGSGSGKAVLLGLEGEDPETVDTGTADNRVHRIHEAGRLRLLGRREVEFKENASISGAEVGCQGEVGSACSMAAAGLAEALGGTPEQVENAAEIGMEHRLGLTCDPVGGLVQIPCIERNALASVKAIDAARMALRGDGTHVVSLDKVIKTMRETGADMKVKYKETSRGGLAVNVIEC
jgi:L-serine deaminase